MTKNGARRRKETAPTGGPRLAAADGGAKGARQRLGMQCWAEQAEAVAAELGWRAGAEGEKRERAGD